MTKYEILCCNLKEKHIFTLALNYDSRKEAELAIKNDVDYDEDFDPNEFILVVHSYEIDEYEDDDWGYNEDEGFDPYEGCYTFDC